jgi:putative ABC transport system substrate-binding protein
MKRREFIKLVGGAAAWPVAARAEQGALPVIGFLNSNFSAASIPHQMIAFDQGLKSTGYIAGRNVAIEFRWAGGQYDRLAMMADDLVHRQVAVIFGGGPPAALAAKAATATIPIVFTSGDDPVKSGLVASLNRPGGNITGISVFTGQLGAKKLGLLRELIPAAVVVAMLVNPNNPVSASVTSDLYAAAATTGHRIHIVHASSGSDVRIAFDTLAEVHANAIIIAADPFFFSQRDELITLAARKSIPAFYELREYPAAGGLISYGASIEEGYRQAGAYTGQILKGAKPAELPVLQPTKFDLVINLNTAKALGLTVPPTLLALADEVIE